MMGILSKYRQALIKVSVNESIYGSKEIYKSLDEAVKKAEKYDEMINYQPIMVKTELTMVEQLQKRIEELEKMLTRRDKWMDAMKEENKVLVDGVKALFNDYGFNSVWQSYSTGHSINFHKMNEEEINKIKSMLEIVENGR